jgi:hypothetical protein
MLVIEGGVAQLNSYIKSHVTWTKWHQIDANEVATNLFILTNKRDAYFNSFIILYS